MSKGKRISTSDRMARLIMLCLLVTVTCPGLLLAQEDPPLKPPGIAPPPPDHSDKQKEPVFVNVDWTYEKEIVEPESSSDDSIESLIDGINYVDKEMDGAPKSETDITKATLQIPIAAFVDNKTGPWQVKFHTRKPLVNIPKDMHEYASYLNSSVRLLKDQVIPWSGRSLNPEEVQRLLSLRELSIELPDSLNNTAWKLKGKVLLPISMKGPVMHIAFLQKRDGVLTETATLYGREPFYIKVVFDKKPNQSAYQVNLVFDDRDPVSSRVSEKTIGSAVYDSAPLYIWQLTSMDIPVADVEVAPVEEEKPTQQYSPWAATFRMGYSEVLEAAPDQGPRKVVAKIDNIAGSANILIRGATVVSSLEIPLTLKLKELDGGQDDQFHLEVGTHKLLIDPAMPQGTAEVLRQEAKQVIERLRQWKRPLADGLQSKWRGEGFETFRIDQPFADVEKFSIPNVILSKQRTLDLSGKDLVPYVKLLYARLMQRNAVKKRLDELMSKLKKAGVSANNAFSLEALLENDNDGFDELHDYLRDFAQTLSGPYAGPFDASRWRRAIQISERQISDIRVDIKKDQGDMLVKIALDGLVASASKGQAGATNAIKKRDSLLNSAKQRTDTLRDQPGLDAAAKKRLTTTAEKYKIQAAAIQALLDKETVFRNKRIEELKAEMQGQKESLAEAQETHRATNKKLSSYRRDYFKHKRAHSTLIADIGKAASTISYPSLSVGRLSPLPDSLGDATPRRLYGAADELLTTRAAYRQWRVRYDETVGADLSAYLETQRSYTLIMEQTAKAMKTAVVVALDAAGKGSRKDEPTFQILRDELNSISAGIDEAASLFSTADSRLEKFQWFLDFADTPGGRKVVEKTRKEMETYANIAKRFKTYAGHADLIMKGLETYDKDTPQAWLEYTLTIAGKVAGKLPVRGGVLGDFLAFYGQAGVACLDAAYDLRDKIVDNDLTVLMDSKGKGAPEYCLYTREQINSNIYHGTNAYDAEEKVAHLATMWQLRRLMYLLRYAGHGETAIKDRGGLGY